MLPRLVFSNSDLQPGVKVTFTSLCTEFVFLWHWRGCVYKWGDAAADFLRLRKHKDSGPCPFYVKSWEAEQDLGIGWLPC
jgi:hypothetical protein